MKKRKGSISVIMVLILLFSLGAVNLPVCAEEAGEGEASLPVYIASEGFSDTQGQNGWSYYGYNGKTGKYLTTSDYKYDTSQSAYINVNGGSARGRIWSGEILPGVDLNTRIGVVRAYTAEEKGTVTIDTNDTICAKDSAVSDFFNVNIRIRKNGVTIYPKNEEWEELTSRTEVSAFQRMEGIGVKKGDIITFEAIRNADAANATAMTKNIIKWDPVIRYTQVVQRQEIYRDTFENGVNTDFWRNKTEGWITEDGCLKNTAANSYIRFYAPHAVNYSMSFDLKFLEIDAASASAQSGFFTMIRRDNGTSNYYKVRLDLRPTVTKKDIVHGVGSGTKNEFTSTAQRVQPGTSAWQKNELYHITESVETDGDANILTFMVKDSNGETIASIKRNFDSSETYPAGGGGFSLTGNHRVAISNFVLEGETSELVIDDDVKFYTDAGFQTPAAAENLDGELYAALKTKSGFSNDFSSKQTPRTIILAAYERGEDGSLILKAVRVNQSYVTSATDTVSVSLNAGETEQGLTYRAFVWDGIERMVPCATVKEL